MMRVTPTRVKIATSVPTSSGRPLCARPPQPAYSPSEFSRTITQSRSPTPTLRKGEATPGKILVGRTLAYWPKPWQIGRAKPPQGDVVGDVGRANRAEIDRVEFLQLGEPVGGHHDAVLPVIVGAPVE